MTQAQQRLHELRELMTHEQVRPGRTAMRSAGLAFLLFNLTAGFVMVTMPLIELGLVNLYGRVWVPLQRWLWAEPTFGGQLAMLINICAALTLLWLARDVLRLWALSAWVWLGRLPRPKPSSGDEKPKDRLGMGSAASLVEKPERPPLEGAAHRYGADWKEGIATT